MLSLFRKSFQVSFSLCCSEHVQLRDSRPTSGGEAGPALPGRRGRRYVVSAIPAIKKQVPVLT